MVRAVICCWQYNCLAVLSFSQRSVGGKGTKTQNHSKRGQKVSAQITINSPECWSRAPFLQQPQKSISSKAPKHSSPGLALRTLHGQECHWAFPWEGTQGMFSQQQFRLYTSQWKQGWGLKPHPKGHYCPASFLPTFTSCFFSFLGSATFPDTAAHHKRCRYTSHPDIIATFAAVSFFSCSSRAFFASCRLSSCCRFSCEELSNCIIIIY